MIEQHLKALKESYSDTTISIAAGWLAKLAEWAGRDLTELGTKELSSWHKHLVWTPTANGKLYSQNTVNQAVGAVRRYYRWALVEGLINSDPTAELVTRAAKDAVSSKLELTPSQTRKLLGYLDLGRPSGIRDRAVLGVLLETQISRPACSRIDLAHLQLDTGALLSHGRTQQIHSLSEGLLADLQRYLEEARPLLVTTSREALFLNLNGGRLSGASIQQLVHYHRTSCGL